MPKESAPFTPEQLRFLRHMLSGQNLENRIEDQTESCCLKEGETPMRFKQQFTINGYTKWITSDTLEGFCKKYLQMCTELGVVHFPREETMSTPTPEAPLFGDYLLSYYKSKRANYANSTWHNMLIIFKGKFIPAFGDKRVNEVTVEVLQKYFEQIGKAQSKESAHKYKCLLAPVFRRAVEDEIILRNPFDSDRITITGKEVLGHKAIPPEKMKEIRSQLHKLPTQERYVCALLSYTGMRYEEVLGLRWEDIRNERIYISRAVVHPSRNQPEVKPPKTKTSTRIVPLAPQLIKALAPMGTHGFVVCENPEQPISYTRARTVYRHIRETFDLREFTAHDFRDTCATEWREAGMPLDMVARLLGHAKTETTEKRYVKYREGMFGKAQQLMTDLWTNSLTQKSPESVVR